MNIIKWAKAVWDMPWYIPFILVFVYEWLDGGIGRAIFVVIGLFILAFVFAGSITLITKIIDCIKNKTRSK